MKAEHRKYIIEHTLIVNGKRIKQDPITIERFLLKARLIARELHREGRFVSLKNQKGVSLPL